jgi:hypothetical protein|tara:strand:- start:337 stop:1776 length:1440 start_codon:yes stop_codon:yes gene_type:complete
MSLLIPGTNSIKDTGYNVANSVRLNNADNAYFSQTPSTSSGTTFTYSMWIKRGNIGLNGYLIRMVAADNSEADLVIESDKIRIQEYEGVSGTNKWKYITNRLFRDPSAWYHIMYVVDTNNGTASDRVQLYINGVRETSFSTATNPSSGATSCLSKGEARTFGGKASAGSFDGYMAECVYVDGTAKSTTDFGEFDEDTGIWKPIDVSSMSLGSNGWYLDFEDSSSLGNDASGSNNWTSNNLTSIDQTTDTCTNNFCTLMSNTPSAANFTLSEGNLVASKSGATTIGLYGSSIMLTKGKWYYESKITDLGSGDRSRMGVAAYESVTGTSSIQGSYSGFEFTGTTSGRFSITVNGSTTEIDGFNSYAQDDIIMWAIDMDNTKLYIGKNGDWFNYSSANTGGDPTSGSGWVTNNATALAAPLTVGYVGHAAGVSDSTEVKINFGNPPYAISSGNSDAEGFGNFEYAVPSGYYSICTKNLAEYG